VPSSLTNFIGVVLRSRRIVFAGLLALGLIMAADDVDAQGAKPRVLLKTNHGDIVVELEPEKTPKTVENFLTYVRDGHYDGTVFHRVILGFMIQGGGFDESLQEKKSRDSIENEADKGLANERGTIAMARTSDPHSASSQFFINTKFNAFLNHSSKSRDGWGYTAFGTVIQGMDIVSGISSVKTGSKGQFGQDAPQENVVIEKATIQE
jgi:peptidyl-prolyl cis-trans isomerase B (cyclophilin B)